MPSTGTPARTKRWASAPPTTPAPITNNVGVGSAAHSSATERVSGGKDLAKEGGRDSELMVGLRPV